jgi:transcriptional regulator with XRE-family HTH domain
MPKTSIRTYSRYSQDALQLLGRLIQSARKEKKMTMQEVSDRVGISRGLLRRIEQGEPTCEIGVVFEVATLLGVPLFELNSTLLKRELRHVEDKLNLLPKSIHPIKKKVDDEF